MSDVRILAQTAAGGTALVAVDGDELPVGHAHPSLYQPVRLYHIDRDELTEPLWLGSAVKFLGGYLQVPGLTNHQEQRVLERVAALLSEDV